MTTDDILQVAIKCQLITTGNRDGVYADALVRFATLIRSITPAEQPAEQEPVAYVCPSSHVTADGSMVDGPDYLEWADEASDYEKRVGTPLYTAPKPAKRVLTDEEIDALPWGPHDGNPITFAEALRDFARAIEAKILEQFK